MGTQTNPAGAGRDQLIGYPLDIEGMRTRVLEAGLGGRTVVCLHGAGSRADRWAPTVPHLVDAGYHLVILDFPGHGLADKPEDFDYTAPELARVVAGAMDALGLSDVIVAGTSLGGHVAATLACERPDLVSDLVLIGTTGVVEYPEDAHRPPSTVADASPANVRSKLEFLVADPALVTDLWVREESMINSSAGASTALQAVGAYINSNRDLVGEDLASLPDDTQILVVWGADDGWTPPTMATAIAELLPRVQLEFMAGCGHAPYFEDPETFTQLMDKHLHAGS